MCIYVYILAQHIQRDTKNPAKIVKKQLSYLSWGKDHVYIISFEFCICHSPSSQKTPKLGAWISAAAQARDSAPVLAF